jgi:anti-sigma B factor antagonist
VASEQGKYPDVRIGEFALEQTDVGVAVLSISGEHDLNTVPELRRRLDELVGEDSSIVVDLSPATFVDSSILGVILEVRRHANDAGLGFAVVQDGSVEAVARVLEITGLRAELPVHESKGDAVADAAGNSAGKAS